MGAFGRFSGRCSDRITAACCAALCIAGASLPRHALAQTAADLLAALPRTSLLAPSEATLVRSTAAEAPGPLERGSRPLSLSLSAPASVAPILMQMPQDQIPGQYTRPKYAVGFQSDSMRRWAEDFGLDAHTCFAPILRARTRLSQDGGLTGSLVMQARCSFH